MSNNSVWPIDKNLFGAITPDLSGPGNSGNKRVFHFSQSSSIPADSPSDCLVSFPGNLLGKSYSLAEMHSVYFAAQAD